MDNLKKKVMVVLVMVMGILLSPFSIPSATSGKVSEVSIQKYNLVMLDKYSKIRRTLTHEELKKMLSLVGFKGKHLKEAWAIAIRESNGRPKAYNGDRSTGDSSYGIFQINMIGNLGPERREKFGLKNNAALFNPVKNAKIAYHMSKGGKDWSSWHGVNAKAKEKMKMYPR